MVKDGRGNAGPIMVGVKLPYSKVCASPSKYLVVSPAVNPARHSKGLWTSNRPHQTVKNRFRRYASKCLLVCPCHVKKEQVKGPVDISQV